MLFPRTTWHRYHCLTVGPPVCAPQERRASSAASPDQSLSLTFIPLPVLVWAALRFDLRTVSWELAGFSVLVTFLSARGYGPFGFDFERGELDAVGMGAIIRGHAGVAWAASAIERKDLE